MNKTKAKVLNTEDYMICKATLSFLFTPLILLMLTGAMIAA
jgi:hypothetical protein